MTHHICRTTGSAN